MRPAGFEPATSRFITLQLSLPSLLMRNVRALDFPFIIPTEVGLDATRQVSTPSPFGAWHGIANSITRKVSPFLSGSTRRVSPTAPNLLGIWRSILLNYGRTPHQYRHCPKHAMNLISNYFSLRRVIHKSFTYRLCDNTTYLIRCFY